jgi:hypothetical protein
MNTLDDLSAALDAYADRDRPRGADAVLAAATLDPPLPQALDRPGTRRSRLLAVAAVALVLVATVGLVRARSGDLGVTTTPNAPDSSSPRALSPVAVPDGLVNVVHVGFDRVWVGTSSDGIVPARLRSFDILSREVVSEVELHGSPTAIAATDGALWVQIGAPPTSGGDQPDPPVDMTLARIDPVAGTVDGETALRGGGPMATRGSRIAVADRTNLMILDDGGATSVTVSIPDAIGHGNVVATDTGPEPAGLAALAFGPDALTALYLSGLPGQTATSPKTGELVSIDAETGRHRSTRLLDPETDFQQLVAHAGSTTWLAPVDRDLVRVDDDLFAEPIGADPAQLVPVDGRVIGLAPFRDGVVALTASAVVVIGDGPALPTPLTGHGRSIVELDGFPWVTQWSDVISGTGTVVSFAFVNVDADGPPATFQIPTTEAVPPSTVVGNGAETILVMEDEPLIDGESYFLLGASLPPGRAILLLCPQADPSGQKDCRTAFDPSSQQVVAVADDGSLNLSWVAQRSLYDSRWHDCAIERCVLRLYGMNAAGGRDLTNVIAETPPLSFSTDAPPIRPTLRVVDEQPLFVGMTGVIIGERFPAHAKGITVGLCRTGGGTGACRYDVYFNQMADADGRVEIPFTIPSGTITLPSLDPAETETIDCTASVGTCSLSIFPDESSVEPYATTPVDIAS